MGDYIPVTVVCTDGYEHEYEVPATDALHAVELERARIEKAGGFFAQVDDDHARWYAFSELIRIEAGGDG